MQWPTSGLLIDIRSPQWESWDEQKSAKSWQKAKPSSRAARVQGTNREWREIDE